MRSVYAMMNGERETVAFAFVSSSPNPYDPAVLTRIWVLYGYENQNHEQRLIELVTSHAKRECRKLVSLPVASLEDDMFNLLSDNGWIFKSQIGALVKEWQ